MVEPQKVIDRASITSAEWFCVQALTKPESSKFMARIREHTSTLASKLEKPWQSVMDPSLVKVLEGYFEKEKAEKQDKGDEKKDKKDKKDKDEKNDKKEKRQSKDPTSVQGSKREASSAKAPPAKKSK